MNFDWVGWVFEIFRLVGLLSLIKLILGLFGLDYLDCWISEEKNKRIKEGLFSYGKEKERGN